MSAPEPPAKKKKKKKDKNKSSKGGRCAKYRHDVLYPRIVQAVNQILAKGDVVTPVEVLVRMNLLRPAQVDDWRRGRIPYLERVVMGNLKRLSRLLRILHAHALDRGLKPSYTAYRRRTRGGKLPLRFTKTGDRNLEIAYATHFVRGAGKGTPPPGRPKKSPPRAKPPREAPKKPSPQEPEPMEPRFEKESGEGEPPLPF